MKHNRKAAEESLDLVYREKQQKMNELDVVVPLRLDQVEPFGLLTTPTKNRARTLVWTCSGFFILSFLPPPPVSRSSLAPTDL